MPWQNLKNTYTYFLSETYIAEKQSVNKIKYPSLCKASGCKQNYESLFEIFVSSGLVGFSVLEHLKEESVEELALSDD